MGTLPRRYREESVVDLEVAEEEEWDIDETDDYALPSFVGGLGAALSYPG